MPLSTKNESPWYANGLRFFCSRCNKCCRHESGYVFLSDHDINRMHKGLGVSREDFLRKYTKVVNLGLVKRVSLIEQEHFDCIFWAKGGCSIYEHRPLQCQSFPFWPQNLDNPDAWEETAQECPGIHLGPKHSKETIDIWLSRRKTEPFVE